MEDAQRLPGVAPSVPDRYLVIGDGEVVLKLSGTIRLGEDENGELLCNPSDAQALVDISVSPRNQLVIRALRSGTQLVSFGDQRFSQISLNRTEVAKLQLPHNEMMLTTDRSGGSEIPHFATLELQTVASAPERIDEPRDPWGLEPPSAEPAGGAALSSVAESLVVSDAARARIAKRAAQQLQAMKAAGVEPDDRPVTAQIRLLDSSDSSKPAPILTAEIPQLEDFVPRKRSPSHSADRGREKVPDVRKGKDKRRSFHVGTFMVGLAVFLLPVNDLHFEDVGRLWNSVRAWQVADPDTLPVADQTLPEEAPELAGSGDGADRALEPSDPENAVGGFQAPLQRLAPPSDITALSTASTEQVALSDPERPVRSEPVRSEPEGAAASTDIAVDVRLSAAVTRRLEEARSLMARGWIVEPIEQNAVRILRSLLFRYPANQETLALLGQCADEVLEDAREAAAAGDDYQARNLVEEVRAFYPAHEGAKKLWFSLTGEAAPG